MGQAKARGTFEERKAAALKKKALNDTAKVEIAKRRRSPKMSKETLMLQAVLAGMTLPTNTKLLIR